MSDLCEHGDIRAACLDCLEGTPPPPKAKPRPARRVGAGYVLAEFEGHCPECDEPVLVGEKITETEPDSRRWGHHACLT